MTNNTHKVGIHWQELDILRGLAAVLMIVNHLGYETLAPNQLNGSLLGNLVFIGSFAPVLFFFVTGVGYGIQSSKKKKANQWYLTLNKLVVLVLADQLVHWSQGQWLGLDFLGFIGFSSLVLELIRNSNSPLAYCLGGFASVSAMRYLLGPYLRAVGYDQQAWGVIGWIFGTFNAPGISYTLSPWLAYPLVGYLIGSAAMRYRAFIEKYRWRVVCGLLMLGVVPALIGIIVTRHGSSFFRWGTVAFGFYAVSFAVILTGLAYSLVMGGESRLRVYQNASSLRGISSLAVVPVHYFLLYLLSIAGVKGLGSFGFCLLFIGVVTMSFLLAHYVESFSYMLRQIQQQKILWLGLVTMVLLTASIALIFRPTSAFLVMLNLTFGQLLLCILFVVRPPVLRLNDKFGKPLPEKTN